MQFVRNFVEKWLLCSCLNRRRRAGDVREISSRSKCSSEPYRLRHPPKGVDELYIISTGKEAWRGHSRKPSSLIGSKGRSMKCSYCFNSLLAIPIGPQHRPHGFRYNFSFTQGLRSKESPVGEKKSHRSGKGGLTKKLTRSSSRNGREKSHKKGAYDASSEFIYHHPFCMYRNMLEPIAELDEIETYDGHQLNINEFEFHNDQPSTSSLGRTDWKRVTFYESAPADQREDCKIIPKSSGTDVPIYAVIHKMKPADQNSQKSLLTPSDEHTNTLVKLNTRSLTLQGREICGCRGCTEPDCETIL